MSSKIDQPPRYPVIVKPDQNVRSTDTSPPQQAEKRNRPQQQSTTASGTKKYPAAQDLQKPLPPVVGILDIENDDLTDLQAIMADKVTFEITQLYSTIENISRENNSLEVKQGLKALEEHIRLREYMHAKRTIIKEE